MTLREGSDEAVLRAETSLAHGASAGVEPARARRWRGVVVLPRMLLGGLLALLVLEGVIRTIYSLGLEDEPGYGYTHPPNSTVIWGLEGHGVSHWLQNGIRQSPVSPGRANTRPVVLLGDSQAEALQVDDDEVFTAVASTALARETWAPAILNAGIASSSLADYVVHAARTERLFHPSWTILLLQENDLESDAYEPTKSHFVRRPGVPIETVFVPPPRRSALGTLVWRLRQRSMLLGYTFVRLGQFNRAAAAEPPLFRAAARPGPEPPAPDYPVEEELDAAHAAYGGRVSFLILSPFDLHAPDALGRVERRALAHCKAAGLHCVNTRQTYGELAKAGLSPFGHSNTTFNAGHMNVEGHRAAAVALEQHLRQLHDSGLL